MELSCPLGTTRRVLREKFPHKPNNKSFIDQVSSVKMAGRTVCLHPQIAKANCSRQSYTQFFVQIDQTQSHFDNTIEYDNIFAFSIVKRVTCSHAMKYSLNCQVVKILERFIFRLIPGSKETITSSKEIILSHQIIFTCARYLNPSISSILN